MSVPEQNLSLEIGEQTITFNSLGEFEFAMSGRTDVPSRKIAELVALTGDELKKEAKAIKAVEQMLLMCWRNQLMSQALLLIYSAKSMYTCFPKITIGGT